MSKKKDKEIQDQFIDNGWFAICYDNQVLEDIKVQLPDIWNLKKTLKQLPNTSEQIKKIDQTRADIESGNNRYIWALKSIFDICVLLNQKGRKHYRRYPQPKSLQEYSINELYNRFPLNDYQEVSVVLILGIQISVDPKFGPGPAAGSIATERPDLVKRKDWCQNIDTGFVDYLTLIEVEGQCGSIPASGVLSEKENLLKRQKSCEELELRKVIIKRCVTKYTNRQ